MTSLDTKIQAVTVYLDRARVTRSGRLDVQAGTQQILVENLPPSLLPESLRASGRGTARARLLSVGGEITYYTEPVQVNVAELEARLEQFSDQDRALSDREQNLAAEAKYLESLAQSGSENLPKGLAFSRADLEHITQFGAYLQQQRAQSSQALQEVQNQRRSLKREIDKVRYELEQVRSPQERERYRALLEVEVREPGTLELELIYVVPNARWQPLYDLRVEEDGEPRVELTYIGQVSQQTGEDWENAQLSLSTAKPAVTAQLPELRPWFIQPYTPPVMRSMGAGLAAMRSPMPAPAMDMMMKEATAGAEPEAEMEEEVADVRESGSAVTYDIRQPVNIPSDGAPHKTTVAILSLTPKLDYLTAPKLTAFAYRRAKVSNSSNLILLPGKLNIFWGSEYIGTSSLKNTAPGQEFEVFLGIDEALRIERKLVQQEVDKRFLSNRRRILFGYRITAENLRKREATLTVLDQVPVSRHEEIKVQPGRVTPAPEPDGEMGMLKWKMTLAPGEKRNIEFEFSVEYPREMNVVGLPEGT